jgi:hypothetical protein
MMSRPGNDLEHSVLARVVSAIALLFILMGVLLNGISDDSLQRLWGNLVDRPGGPMSFRFILQPTMALIAATHDGIRDAQLGRSPYFWTVWSEPMKRAGRLREGLVSTARIMLLGIGMDAIYQLIVLKTFYPAEAVLIAIALFVPYALLRGPISRIAHWWFDRTQKGSGP